jgi:hypothetical protein
MCRRLSLFLLVTMPLAAAFGQYVDFGVIGGLAKYQGDLTPRGGDVELNPAYGIFIRHHFNQWAALRCGIQGGRLSGDDANNSDESVRRRNLSFRAPITEFSFTGEFNLLPYVPGNPKKGISPYLQAGIAFLHFRPQALINDRWINLQPLATEGQGMREYTGKRPYQLLQIVFPVGMGFRYALSKKANIGFDFAWRFTLTDYLDDVSGNYADPAVLMQNRGELSAALSNRTAEYTGVPAVDFVGTPRGNPRNKDSYFIFGLFFSYNFYDLVPFSRSERIKKVEEPGKWF